MNITIETLEGLYASLPPRPKLEGRIDALCVRPGPSQREARDSLVLHPERGAIGDRWEIKTWLYLPDGRPDPRVQVTLCNSRVLAMIQSATGVDHHPGDTIFTDLDLSGDNIPVGSRLAVGNAVLAVSDVENDACAKFASHYGAAVFEWIRRPQHRPLRLRGLFARVLVGGVVNRGDPVRKLTETARP